MRSLKKFLIFSGLALILALSTQRCYYDNAEDLYGLKPDTIDTTPPSFATNVKPLFDTRCAIEPCHVSGNPLRKPLTTYDEIKLAIENENLQQRVVNKSMPQGSTLSAAQISLIDRWINEGYQNN